jgi:hypothetical protein
VPARILSPETRVRIPVAVPISSGLRPLDSASAPPTAAILQLTIIR